MTKDKDWKKSVGKRRKAVRVKKKTGQTKSSHAWISRQVNDPYVAAAQELGYRSRAAFKLLQLDEKYKILRRGQNVLDLGAAPGGWVQVALAKVGKGNLFGIDLLPIDPIDGAELVIGDMRDDASIAKVTSYFKDGVDVVLSDMAPNSTGDASTDHLRVIALAEIALDVAVQVLKPDGWFVCKFWQGGAEGELRQKLQKHFKKAIFAKPEASRKESAEMYLVAQGFRD
ncbi:MAG: RlmE family RNA methyltransferase [Alphaproteobacteria bacterium]|nr:MAG: RlmE family RNA methyltransferase [Alphaproteobacteria bacterium]